MATLTRKVLKLVAIGSVVPAVGIAVGYRIRSSQAQANSSQERRVYRACDLPIYTTSNINDWEGGSRIPYPRNTVEENIGVARRSVQDFFGHFAGTYDTVRATTATGFEISKATLEYVQTNPGELPRVVFIVVAGMGGIVLGYRGGPLRKISYGSVAAVSCAALCYPKKTLELSYSSLDYVKELWKENVGIDLVETYWPFRKDEKSETSQEASEPTIITGNTKARSSSEKQPRLKGDIGQANPADKDLYSTRTS